ncbi:MAG: hypothetical protein JHC33_05135 [Ignisphaera sp.]|nr:hypothetical protein [Ignisphaera sp.]
MPQTDKNSPAAQAELDRYKIEHDKLIQKHAAQEAVLLRLLSASPQDTTKITETKSKIAEISREIAQKTAEESQHAASLNTDSISAAAQRQALIKTILAVTPKPSAGNVAIVHPSINSAAILDYMTFTQHLNPYGRKRQCDRDLENILALIANDLGDQFVNYVRAVKAIKDAKKT